MEFTIMQPTRVYVKYVDVVLPVRYDDEDMPTDFPMREGDIWKARIMVGSGQILEWPEGVEYRLYMKVTDGGSYTLVSAAGTVVASIDQNYVPHSMIPGDYGDYVEFDIGGDGVIKNWLENPSIEDFLFEDLTPIF